MNEDIYELKRYVKILDTGTFYENFSKFDRVQGFCKNCPRYNTNFSCSPVEDINIENFVKQYDKAKIVVTQLLFKKEYYEKEFTKKEFDEFINSTFIKEREYIKEIIKNEENDHSKSISLTGPCNYCRKDCKKVFDKCKYPEIRRFTLASLGLDANKILKELFDIDLILIEKKLPKYMNNVTVLLYTD